MQEVGSMAITLATHDYQRHKRCQENDSQHSDGHNNHRLHRDVSEARGAIQDVTQIYGVHLREQRFEKFGVKSMLKFSVVYKLLFKI